MNMLVTGEAGYIGSGLIVKLHEEFPDANITSLDNLHAYKVLKRRISQQ